MTAADPMLQALAEELPPAFFDSPLECMFADNFRCRVLCNVLDQIAGGKAVDLETLGLALRFLRVDFVSHLADAEHALFPLLRERVQAADWIEGVLADLWFPQDLLVGVVEGLTRLETTQRGHALDPGLRRVLETFVRTERRHVSVENVVLLPLARRRLSQSDLTWLGHAMRSRRLPEPSQFN